MCGVFGFVTSEGEGPKVAQLQRLAVVTQTRGAHAFGLAWLTRDGEIKTFKRPGPATDYLDHLFRCRDAVVVLGHCRFATHGSPKDNRNNHPHPAGAGFIVHNGVIGNDEQLVRQHGLTMQSECDSEVLGLLMARAAGSILQRAVWTANQVHGDLVMLGLWKNPARMLIVRRGRPLHFGQGPTGFYFASLPNGLPGQVKPVADGMARVLAFDGDELRLDGEAVRLA